MRLTADSARPSLRLRRAFSLIELLGAILIIAILGTLVGVVLQNIQGNSQLVKSLSIIRQYQSANSLYSLDHGGLYVPIRTMTEEGLTKRWVDQQDFKDHLNIPPGADWPLNLLSPNAGVLDENGKPLLTRSYGINTLGFSDWFNPSISYQASVATIEDPVNTIAFTDALDWIVAKHGIKRYPGEEVYAKHAVAFRYDGKATVVFFDGHTGAYTMDEMLENKQKWWNAEK